MNIKYKNESKKSYGQMTIFIALIFQVLFVFFAMVINIGMIIHDKINLQNSVDLAAYYAAQRQAEMLNVIAHTNYQIRQAWKLLTFRYRVLGSFAHNSHPSNPYAPYPVSDSFHQYAPGICISNHYWVDSKVAPSENHCSSYNMNVPIFNPPLVVTPDIFNIMVSIQLNQLRQSASGSCKFNGPNNWLFGSTILFAYRQEQAQRIETIRKVAGALYLHQEDFIDINGQKISDGVKQTIEKNLTFANSQFHPKIELFNSLGGTSRSSSLPPWLHVIEIHPLVFYVDYSNCGSAVQTKVRSITEEPNYGYPQNTLVLQQSAGTEPPSGHQLHDTIGVEKNPWHMPYVAVQATVERPAWIFSPFTGKSTVSITAKAYAKPFGGRMGPWYNNSWPPQSSKSDGGAIVDPLLPPQGQYSGNALKHLPNFSRYPGDSLGYVSKLTLSVLHDVIGINAHFLKLAWYDQLMFLIGPPVTTIPQGNGDLLAWELNPINGQNPHPWIRDYEVAAIAPDLFDAYYYSVEPNFEMTYVKSLKNTQWGSINGAIRLDLGARPGFQNLNSYSIKRQIADATSKVPQQIKNLHYYWLRSSEHLLTDWNQESASDYTTFPSTSFGKCAAPAIDNVPTPGNCAIGGRVGYSVKLVSENYLRSNDLDLGNSGKGQIANPPKF